MDTQLYDEWIAALRSGKYPQGRNQLHNTNPETFCCLGVLCELLVEKKVVIRNEYDYLFDTQDERGILEMYTSLCPPVQKMVGLSNADVVKLIDRNDEDGKSFPEIADWLAERKRERIS